MFLGGPLFQGPSQEGLGTTIAGATGGSFRRTAAAASAARSLWPRKPGLHSRDSLQIWDVLTNDFQHTSGKTEGYQVSVKQQPYYVGVYIGAPAFWKPRYSCSIVATLFLGASNGSPVLRISGPNLRLHLDSSCGSQP